ncbi:SDR family oxidoreductase [Gimesia fumaroli]|jgi:NAD(P)-dependent dehydrogenase (short-subunit alcohol dehydrogenase family)|uniref:Putative oxidoreductase UxuB n=1 Tax=Gimesia fumaroli TaxID=2527976 RepID=A0A518IK16_9PLAN|nr:SDR family oxidoreductase [Gimesia fumaroli]QDV53385.1 putative oxidoreductase UxuB [Gimesia fumaroli]
MSESNSSGYLQALFGLSGKTAVVIGGTGVLGGAIADALAQAGAHVVIVGRNAENGDSRVKQIETLKGSAEFFAADSTSRSDLEALVAHLKAKGQMVDILVNGAGINAATPFLEISDEEWEKIFRVNLLSVKVACQVFGQAMLDENVAGSIINIASMSAITPLSRVFTYSASKAAVLNLTQNLAREWAERGIRVNALSPGFFPAEQNRKVLTPERVASIMNHTPTNRFGDPEELAGAVLLMAAGKAGSFITGTNIAVDGGFSCMTI